MHYPDNITDQVAHNLMSSTMPTDYEADSITLTLAKPSITDAVNDSMSTNPTGHITKDAINSTNSALSETLASPSLSTKAPASPRVSSADIAAAAPHSPPRASPPTPTTSSPPPASITRLAHLTSTNAALRKSIAARQADLEAACRKLTYVATSPFIPLFEWMIEDLCWLM
jgi:hypothetical protein